MHRLTARAPARWPIIRGRRRRAAHRPLPSMMTARWRGRVIEKSYRHQFLFLGLDHLVDVLDALVGELLDFVAAAALVVLRDLLLLEQVLDLADGVAAGVADRDRKRTRLNSSQ